MNKKLVLIDGHSILNRAFYGVPELTNSEGLHTNAVYGFLNIMFKILEEEKANYLTVAFDVKHPTFRHLRYAEYKGTRKPMPEELHEQVPIIKEVLQAMGITIMEKPGYEADDILGTIAKKGEQEGYEVSVVSGDRDLLQLATDKIMVRIPKTKFGKTVVEDYHTADVIEKYAVTPLQIIDLKGLMGDASDNIPGVPGIGEKTAAKIIGQFKSVENAIDHIEEVMPNRARESLRANEDLARLSKELATIKLDCELEYNIEETKIENLYTEEAFLICKRLEFKSILTKFEAGMGRDNHMEEKFLIIHEKKEANTFMQRLIKDARGYVGCAVLEAKVGEKEKLATDADGQFYLFETPKTKISIFGVTFCYDNANGEEVTAFLVANEELSDEYFENQIILCKEKAIRLAFIDLKSQLKKLPLGVKEESFDAGVASYLLNPLKDTYHADDIARDYLDINIPSYEELFGKHSWKYAWEEKRDDFYRYACYQSSVAKKAYPELKMRLEKVKMWDLFEKVEMPLIYTLYDMECRGIGVNREELKQYGDRLATGIGKLEKDIYELVGETFNINSPKQLGIILFEKLKLPFAKKTKTGYSTSVDILDKLRSEDPVIGMILEYRQMTKLKSTYADGLANYIDPRDSRIHGTFNQTITATGRISSTEPNLQNIPIKVELGRQIRKVFIPKEGYVFLDADYSQIELRVLAHMSDDESLIQAYKEEQDIHRITASKVFHTPLDEVTKQQRSNAKAVNFGIVYGISSFSLGQDLNITKKEADIYIQKYFETYPGVKRFLEKLVEDAKETGYGTTLFGRLRPIPELSSGNFMQRSFGERVAMNSPIQGTAADIIKIAMIRVNERLKALKLKSELILQVHDELLIEAHQSELEQVKDILYQEMFHAAELKVPLEVEVEQGNNWYEAK